MTAKLLQAYSKLYTFVTFCNISHHLSISWAHEPTQLWICLYRLSIRLAFKFAHVERDQSRKKKWPESTGIYGKKQKLHSIHCSQSLTVSHSCGFIQCHSCWADHLGNLLADIPRKLRHALKAVQNQLFPKRTVSHSYPHLSMQFHASKSTENSTREHLEKL